MGFSLATVIGGHYGNKIYHAVSFLSSSSSVHLSLYELAARNDGEGKPEMRVPAILFGAVIVPIGLLYVANLAARSFTQR